jgi:sugar O-acyltransferase (sialic acid O-acetyltransferase NeuD family)
MTSTQTQHERDPEGFVIVGTGGHAAVVAALIAETGAMIRGYADPGRAGEERAGEETTTHEGLSLRTRLEEVATLLDTHFAIAIGDPSARARLTQELRALDAGASLPVLLHPRCTVERFARLASGVQVCIGAIVAARAELNEGVIVNSGAIVEHECRIGAFAHIAPGARLGGRVTVGERAHVGLGAAVNQTLTIGADAVVGAGAVVTRDVAPGTTVVGVPARPVSRRGDPG